MFTRHLLICVLSLLLGGCGSSSSHDFVSAGNGTLNRGEPRSGTVALASVVARVPVEAVTSDGQVIDKGTTGVGGRFHLENVPVEGRVVARIPNGPALAADLDGQERRWLWIGPVTTMVSRYRQLHPGLSVAEAEARVARYLRIPSGVNLGSGLGRTYRSPFSWDALQQAAGNTDIDSFLDQQVAAIDSGQTRAFRLPDPFPAIHELLNPRLRLERLARAQIRAQFGELVATVGTNIFSNYLGGAVKGLGGWICEGLGLNFGTSAQLSEIQSQLTAIQNDLNTLNAEVVNLTNTVNSDFALTSAAFNVVATQTAFTAAQQTLLAPVTDIQTQVGHLTSAVNTVGPLQRVSTPQSAPPSAVSEFAIGTDGAGGLNQYAGGGTGQLFRDLSTMRQLLQGLNTNPNIVLLYASVLQQQIGNASPTGPNLFADWRSNAILHKEQTLLDLYRAVQVLGLYLVSEWCHLDGVTFPIPNSNPSNLVSANIGQAIQTLRQLSRDLVVEQQQVPPASLGGVSSPVDDVLLDVTGGVMWYTVMGYEQYYNSENINNSTLVGENGGGPLVPPNTAGIYSDSLQFSFGPWGEGVWRLPSLTEMGRLQELAFTAGGGDPTRGLQAMGFNLGGATPGDIQLLCQGPPSQPGPDGAGILVNGQFVAGAPPAMVAPDPVNTYYVIAQPIENFSLYLYDMQSGTASTPQLETNSSVLQAGVAYPYFFVRSCPGLTQVSPPQGEDVGTLAACALGTIQAGSNPAQVSSRSSYTAQLTPPQPYGVITASTDFDETGFTTSAALTSQLDVTAGVAWSSSDVSQVDVSNLPGQAGNITYHTANPSGVSIAASLITGLPGSAQATTPATSPTVAQVTFPPSQLPNGANPSAPALTSILVTSCNRLYSSATGTPPVATDSYFATGFYSDNTVRDLTNNVTWSAATRGSGTGAAVFNPGAPNVLQVPQSVGSGNVTVSASFQGISGMSQAGTAFFIGSTAPTVTSVIPPSSNPGRSITVLGTNLASTTSVTLASTNATFVPITDTELSVVVPTLPAGVTGAVTLTVTTPAGSATANFVYTP